MSVLAWTGCVATESSSAEGTVAWKREMRAHWNVAIADAETGVALLRYKAPTQTCSQVYRITTAYTPQNRDEADGVSFVALGAGRGGTQSTHHGHVAYQGVRAEQRPLVRDVTMSATAMGPAAPTVACTFATWDPIEDALALGWPRLPGRLTATGERWTGLRVEGRCNLSACVNPRTGGGGSKEHHRLCVTQSWQQQLIGVVNVGGRWLAAIQGTWNDGHNPAQAAGVPGIWAENRTLISIADGRPVWGRTVISHRLAQPRPGETIDGPRQRHWTLEAMDDCGEDFGALAGEARLEVDAPLAAIVQQLASAGELRHSPTAPTTDASWTQPAQ